MKIVIADDENLIRASLKSMLDEAFLPSRIVGEAVNGEELVSLISKHQPDIAFVDIKMPKINGLEAIRLSKEISPHTQWVILTGFSEFDYAREALTLGVSHYLLKPVSPDELIETLNDIVQRSKKLIQSLNKDFENDLMAIVHELSTLPETNEDLIFTTSNFLVSSFIIDSSLDESSKAKHQQVFCQAIRSTINELLTSDVRLSLISSPGGDLATVGVWGFAGNEKPRSTIQRYFERIEYICKQFSNNKFAITILQSEDLHSFEEFQKTLNQIQNLSVLRVITEYGKKIFLKSLSKQLESFSPALIEFANILLKLSNAYKGKTYMQYMKTLDDLEKALSTNSLLSNADIKKSAVSFLTHSINCGFDLSQEPKLWIPSFRQHGEQILIESQRDENISQDIVSQVIYFIEQNYMNDIGIAQIAEQLNVTPNYLSTLFHKKKGTTFMKHLTKVRMLKAKELLSNQSIQVQQVAESVGYYSTRHFTKLFKEFFGCYPSDYRNQFPRN